MGVWVCVRQVKQLLANYVFQHDFKNQNANIVFAAEAMASTNTNKTEAKGVGPMNI